MGFPWWLSGKESPVIQETWFLSVGWEDPLEEDMATHSITLAWRIPGTENLAGHKESDTAEATEHAHTQPLL